MTKRRPPKLGYACAVIAATKRDSDCWRLDIRPGKAQDALYRAAETPAQADDYVARAFRLHRSKGRSVRLSAGLSTMMADERGA